MFAIGLVGPFGSGCTYIGKWIQENREYVLLSLSDELRTFLKRHIPKRRLLVKNYRIMAIIFVKHMEGIT